MLLGPERLLREWVADRLRSRHQQTPARAPRSLGPDTAGAVEKSAKKSAMEFRAEEFEADAARGGAQRDMAIVRQKMGCDYDVSEFYIPRELSRWQSRSERKEEYH